MTRATIPIALLAVAALAAAKANPAWASTPVVQSGDLVCTYERAATRDMTRFDHCAWTDQRGQIHLYAKHLRRLNFDRYGLASVVINTSASPGFFRWFYVRRDGHLVQVETMDNAADPFVDGLARADMGAKVGFINRNLDLVIPARFDGAFPFDHGSAVVCIGCVSTWSTRDEAGYYQGGRWACIDRAGRLTTPLMPHRDFFDACHQRG